MTRQQVPNRDLGVDSARTNWLVNPGFEIWQRGTSFTATPGATITADRWYFQSNGTSAGTCVRDTADVDGISGAAMAVTCTATNATNTDYANTLTVMSMNLNEVGGGAQLLGRQVSFSIRVKSNTANSVVTPYFYSSGGAPTIQLGTPVTLAASTWTTITYTFTNSTGGSWYVGIHFHTVATYKVDNATLVVGSVPAEFAPLHPADDLHRCQRYYEVIGAASTGAPSILGYASVAGETWGITVSFKATKAVVPTLTKVGTWNATNCGQPLVDQASFDSCRMYTSAIAVGAFGTSSTAASSLTVEANP